MTVKETLDLSARCQGVGFKYGKLFEFCLFGMLDMFLWLQKMLNDSVIMVDMLMELTRREKIAGIRPDEDLDIFMKVCDIQ